MKQKQFYSAPEAEVFRMNCEEDILQTSVLAPETDFDEPGDVNDDPFDWD